MARLGRAAVAALALAAAAVVRAEEPSAGGDGPDITAQLQGFQAEGGGSARPAKFNRLSRQALMPAAPAPDMATTDGKEALSQLAASGGPGDDATSSGGPVSEEHQYKHTEATAVALDKAANEIKADVENAKQDVNTTLTGDKDLIQQAFNLFGDSKDKKDWIGLKHLDMQAHQLRGHLQQQHEWMTDVLEHVISDFQHMDPAQHPQPTEKIKTEYKPDEAATTGLTKIDAKDVKEAVPWDFKFTTDGGATTGGTSQGQSQGDVTEETGTQSKEAKHWPEVDASMKGKFRSDGLST